MLIQEAIALMPKTDISKSKEYFLSRISKEIGSEPIAKMDSKRVKRWAQTREGSKHTTVQLIRTLSGVMTFAREILDEGPGSSETNQAKRALVKQKILPMPEKRNRRISDDELDAIAAHWPAKRIGPQILYFAVNTCLRVSEICDLRWSDIDGTTLTVRRAKINQVDKAPILPATQDIIDRLPRKGELLFPLGAQYVSDCFTKAALAAGIPDIRFHDLRHEGISRLFDHGLTIPQVAVISGHRSWASLARYTHPDAQAVIEAFENGRKD